MQLLIQTLPLSFRDRYRSEWHKIKLEFQISCGKFQRLFFRPSIPKLENQAMYLHLGCGSVNHPKFINIDGIPAPHIHYIRAVDDLSIFKENSIDLIYCSHCLEHFSYAQVPKVLAEWFRVLKPGGILRLSVPNFDLLLAIYTSNNNDINSIQAILMGGQEYKFNFHLAVFNHSNLEILLKDTGFKQIQEWQPGSSDLTTFNDLSTNQFLINSKFYSVSLNLEAIK